MKTVLYPKGRVLCYAPNDSTYNIMYSLFAHHETLVILLFISCTCPSLIQDFHAVCLRARACACVCWGGGGALFAVKMLLYEVKG